MTLDIEREVEKMKEKKTPKVFWTYGVRVPIEIKDRLAGMPKNEYKEFTKKIKEILAGTRSI